jgi:hypothetical protein
MEPNINMDENKANFVAEVQQKSRELGSTDQIRLDSLLDGSAYQLVSKATGPDNPRQAFAREIIEKMYLAVFGGQTK